MRLYTGCCGSICGRVTCWCHAGTMIESGGRMPKRSGTFMELIVGARCVCSLSFVHNVYTYTLWLASKLRAHYCANGRQYPSVSLSDA